MITLPIPARETPVTEELVTETSERGQPIPQQELDELEAEGFSETELRAKIDPTLFDAESGKSQTRDEGGKFADEGKGSQERGYHHPGDKVTVNGSADGRFTGQAKVKVVDPHSNKAEVASTDKSGRQYDKQGHRHIPRMTVELDRSKRGLSPLRFEAHHHQVTKAEPIDTGDKAGKVTVTHEEEPDRRISTRVSSADSDTQRKAFQGAIERTHEEHPFGAAVSVKDPQFYQDKHTKLFLSEDKLAGIAVSPDGDLVSGFKHPGSKTDFNELLDAAAPLTTHLDAFTSGDGHLPELYAQHGYRPIARIAWNDKYAPKDWPEKAGKPDVVFMVRDTDNKLKLPDVTAKGYNAVEKDIPLVKDFDTARAKQLEAVSKLKGTDIVGLDKAIADYKPDRSLSDPSKTVRIDKLLPNVAYTPYSKTPFFARVNVLQGSIDPLRYGVGDYIKSRDLMFDTIPATKVSLDNVVVTQPTVNKDRVQQLVDKPETGGTKAIQAVKYNGKTYILNGHHRVAALLREGQKNIEAHLLDLDHADPTPPKTEADIPRYLKELGATPEFRTVEDRLNSMGATNGEREGWSLRQNTTDGSTNPDKLTPERKALHEKIIKSFLDPKAVPPPGQKPHAIFLMGKPGAGKTFSSAEVLKGFGRSMTVGCDLIREMLPEYRGWNTPATQEEAKMIATELTQRALAAGENIVFDEVGSSYAKLSTRAKLLTSKEVGYDVNLVHVDAPLEQSAKVVWDRFKESGRFTDPGYLLNDVDHKPGKTYETLKENPDIKSWVMFDNKGFKRKLVDQGSR